MKEDNNLILGIILFVVVVWFLYNADKRNSCIRREGYRDPIYLNREKLAYDWYPRANGSIYGFPYRYGGSWSIFSGYPYYDTAY